MIYMASSMKKINILIFTLFLIFIFSSFVFAEEESLGIIKQDTCVKLIQTCANCSYINFTAVLAPNNTVIAENLNTTKTGSFFFYDCLNATDIGTYIVNGIGDIENVLTIFSYTFTVTPDGTEPSTSQGLMYSFMMFILVILFSFCVVGAFKIEGKNEFDVGGGLIKINFNKYYKFALFFLSYLLLIFISFTTYQISLNFLFLTLASTIFYFIFETLYILLVPIFFIFVIVNLVKIILDSKLQDLANRHLKPYSGDRHKYG